MTKRYTYFPNSCKNCKRLSNKHKLRSHTIDHLLNMRVTIQTFLTQIGTEMEKHLLELPFSYLKNLTEFKEAIPLKKYKNMIPKITLQCHATKTVFSRMVHKFSPFTTSMGKEK